MASCSSSAILGATFLLLLISQMISDTRSATASVLLEFDSIYQFGDSISDTGNLKRESKASHCNFSPYGETFFDKPTGRCSNGLLIVDFFARAFKLPLLNPYLEKDADFSHGINFAVAGATTLDASRFPGALTNSSLSVQLGWFRNHLNFVCASPDSSSSGDCKKKFARTLFIVGQVGGNDYNYLLSAGRSLQELYNLVPTLIQSITTAVKEVIDHGGVDVVVPGIFPIGCVPDFHDQFRSNTYDDLGCIKSLNDLTTYHNDQLQQALKVTQKQNPSVVIRYGDSYNALRWILGNAAYLGFEKNEVFNQCCGNTTNPCGTTGSRACLDPEKRMSWDGLHPTQQVNKHASQWLLSDIFLQAVASPSPLSSPTLSIASMLT